MDPDACGFRSGPELARDHAVLELVDDAEPNGVALTRWQLVQRLVEAFEPRIVGLGPGLDEEPEALAGRPLETTLAHRPDEHVPCDREQPGPGRPVELVAEAGTREPRLGERLCGQVVRSLGLASPAQVVAVDAPRVPLVEDPEGAGVGARGR